MTARRNRLVALALVVALTAGCDSSIKPSNATRYQPAQVGVVSAHKRYGAKSYWLQVDRGGAKTWGKVSRAAYGRCSVGERWPSCKAVSR